MPIDDRSSKEDAEPSGVRVPAGGREEQRDFSSSNEVKDKSKAGPEGTERRLKKVLWIMAALIAFLCGLSVVNIAVSRSAHESIKKQGDAISKLTESLREMQKSMAQLKKKIEELSGAEEEGNETDIAPWDGKI